MALKKVGKITQGKPYKTAKLPKANVHVHIQSPKAGKPSKIKTHETGHL